MLTSPFSGDEAVLMQYAFLHHNIARVDAWLSDGDPAKEPVRVCWQLLSPLLASVDASAAAICAAAPSLQTVLSAYNLHRLTDRSNGRVVLKARHATGVRTWPEYNGHAHDARHMSVPLHCVTRSFHAFFSRHRLFPVLRTLS